MFTLSVSFSINHLIRYLVISTLPEDFFLLFIYTIANTAPPMHRKITTTAAITPPAIAPVDS